MSILHLSHPPCEICVEIKDQNFCVYQMLGECLMEYLLWIRSRTSAGILRGT